MPRKDGFPTNEELLSDFNQKGRDIFVAAFEHDLAYKMPDEFKGKKLGYLALTIEHIIPEPEEMMIVVGHVDGESLDFRLMDNIDAEYVKDFHLRWRNTSIGDEIAIETTFCGDAILDDDFNPAIIGKWALQTDYTATMRNTDKTRHVGTLKEKPAKQSLHAGIALEKSAALYVASAEFEVPYVEREQDAAMRGMQNSIQPFSHDWKMEYRSGMTFNGYESKKFLEHAIRSAHDRVARCNERIECLISMSAPEFLIEKERVLIEDAHISLISAKTALDKK